MLPVNVIGSSPTMFQNVESGEFVGGPTTSFPIVRGPPCARIVPPVRMIPVPRAVSEPSAHTA